MTPGYRLAMSAGRDAAMRQMRSAGRTSWNRADYNLAARVFERILRQKNHRAEPRENFFPSGAA